MTFEFCMEKVGAIEGKLSLSRSDRGNWTSGIVGVGKLVGTKYGISVMAYPHLNIPALTKAEALMIYKKDFWDAYKLEQFAPHVRLYVIDCMINHGQTGGIELAQKVFGVSADGVVGPMTLAASYRCSLWDFCERRGDYYVDITQNGKNDENDRKQLKGWGRRNVRMLKHSVMWQLSTGSAVQS